MTAIAPTEQAARASEISAALRSLTFLRKEIASAAAIDLSAIHPSYQASAANLLGYLALRRHDIRVLQTRLAALGLSSLGRCESDVLGSVDRVIQVLKQLAGGDEPEGTEASLTAAPQAGNLQDHALALFGPAPKGRAARIMVTMPTEASQDYALVERLLVAGMNCQRINCAHDGPEQWAAMVDHGRTASRQLGRPCLVAMDLPGPKLRTGPVGQGTAVLKVRPERAQTGAVREPARLFLTAEPCTGDEAVRVSAELLKGCQAGDVFKLRDAREAKRALEVVECTPQGCWVTLHKTAYLTPGLKLKCKQPKGGKRAGRILEVPAAIETIRLHEGDLLMLTLGEAPGTCACVDAAGQVVTPARIGCNSPNVFSAAQPGDPIWFDDGKIGGVIVTAAPDALEVRIQHAPGGAKLKADKGINLPSTDLGIDALGDDDVSALSFAARHADIVELSFVNRARDVQLLLEHLERLNASKLGIVLKIETRQGFEQLPELLLAGMRNPRFGVMIARGDLAVEAGFERTAELQEEMLCLCEAAHVPVIWATQVLESQAKTGAPSRAEITDAAMGVRADCVMLNKGPYVHKAVATLDDLLRRMQGHHQKKRHLMRKLNVADLPIRDVSSEATAS